MSVCAARGFVANGVACGVKATGALDLALVATASGGPVAAAATFTSNRAAAAPVQVSRRHLSASGGRAAAVVLNSGNANAATGPAGVEAAEAMAAAVAGSLGCEAAHVLVCSTGLIGIPLDAATVVGAIPSLVEGATPERGRAAAEAIRTTDTFAKESVAAAGAATVGGMAKGAAMLAPDMATMLAVITTDASVAAPELQEMLGRAVDRSFNVLSVDGCTSTNDTVIALAGGEAGVVPAAELEAALTRVCTDLAMQMARDAEGATKVARITVTGAASDADAARAARRIAESQLVKCSLYGCDPYWGRVVSEAGSSGAAFDLDRVSVRYGGIEVCAAGAAVEHDEAAVGAHMAGRDIDVEVDLALGDGRALVITNDLTHAYVDENMGTS